MSVNQKIAVVIYNLGGPDSLSSVKPFLFNLFNDSNIIGLPNPLRYILAKFISSRRAPYASKIYEKIGGRSPILEETQAQAKELTESLKKNGLKKFKVFIYMRYWHPLAEQTVAEVKEYNPDRVILLPLYPQFSTTTTESSITHWNKKAKKLNLKKEAETVCCYPDNLGFINAYTKLIQAKIEEAYKFGKPRILFSAHGIPLNRVKAGDPYEWQVRHCVEKIIEQLQDYFFDYKITYQSKVGPLKWLQPATEQEIITACEEKLPLVIVPIAFVSEHSETLVELDIQYKELSQRYNCPGYFRVPTVGIHPDYINGLAELVLNKVEGIKAPRKCPPNFSKCVCANQ